MLKYKGYSGKAEFDDFAGLFCGEVIGTRDVVTFQGNSVDEIKKAFEDSIDDYLDFCNQRGEKPDKPFSGKLILRISPSLHSKIYVKASKTGKSLNKWIADLLNSA